MESCIGERDTVRRDQQIGIVKIRGCRIQELELYRPLAKFGIAIFGWLAEDTRAESR